jgi:hypothetical protein
MIKHFREHPATLGTTKSELPARVMVEKATAAAMARIFALTKGDAGSIGSRVWRQPTSVAGVTAQISADGSRRRQGREAARSIFG